jgi:hypothetical protein
LLPTFGLRLSEVKTRVVHLIEGFPFLGLRIQWRRRRGTGKWHAWTFIDDQPVRTVKTKIRALTSRTSQLDHFASWRVSCRPRTRHRYRYRGTTIPGAWAAALA